MNDTIAPDAEFPKVCGCGRVHDRAGWNALPRAERFNGLYFDSVETIELRHCYCGSSIAVSLGEGDFTEGNRK